MSSDRWLSPTPARAFRLVSIPSSSGHVFGLAQSAAQSSAGTAGFNPLVIGACLRTCVDPSAGHSETGLVSIPSSSGHVFGLTAGNSQWQTSSQVSIPSSSGHVFGLALRSAIRSRHNRRFQSPRHRGMSSDSDQASRCGRYRGRFQSPRHRGMSSDRSQRAMRRSRRWQFQSPRHRGMSSDRRCRHRVNARLTVSIPSSSGHVFGRCRHP